MACAFVALNTFFDKKRGQAVGFSMAGTALGMMLVPQVRNIFSTSKEMHFSQVVVIYSHTADTHLAGLVRISRHDASRRRLDIALSRGSVFIASS